MTDRCRSTGSGLLLPQLPVMSNINLLVEISLARRLALI
jgi:hypothetical protein